MKRGFLKPTLYVIKTVIEKVTGIVNAPDMEPLSNLNINGEDVIRIQSKLHHYTGISVNLDLSDNLVSIQAKLNAELYQLL